MNAKILVMSLVMGFVGGFLGSGWDFLSQKLSVPRRWVAAIAAPACTMLLFVASWAGELGTANPPHFNWALALLSCAVSAPFGYLMSRNAD